MGESTNPFPLRDKIISLYADLGIDPDTVAEVIIKPREIQIRRFTLTPDGEKILDHLGQAKTYVDLMYWV